MRRYSEAVKADVRRRMSPPHRQSVAWISEELGIHLATLYNWRKAWRLRWVPFIGQLGPLTLLTPDGWNRVLYQCRPHGEFCLPVSCGVLHGSTSR